MKVVREKRECFSGIFCWQKERGSPLPGDTKSEGRGTWASEE